MARKFLIPLLTIVFLAAPAAFGPVAPLGLSGSALAGKPVVTDASTPPEKTAHEQFVPKRVPGKKKSGK